MAGAIDAPSSYFMKAPPTQFTDNEARNLLEKFIESSTENP